MSLKHVPEIFHKCANSATCPCNVSMLHSPATCPISVYLTRFCPRYILPQHVPATCPLVWATIFSVQCYQVPSVTQHEKGNCLRILSAIVWLLIPSKAVKMHIVKEARFKEFCSPEKVFPWSSLRGEKHNYNSVAKKISKPLFFGSCSRKL